jgi:hypothetical protein
MWHHVELCLTREFFVCFFVWVCSPDTDICRSRCHTDHLRNTVAGHRNQHHMAVGVRPITARDMVVVVVVEVVVVDTGKAGVATGNSTAGTVVVPEVTRQGRSPLDPHKVDTRPTGRRT